jgi:NADPH2 dehydrogenase
VDWIPVDLLSAAIFEIGITPPSSSSSQAAQVVHAVNPQTVQWKESLLPVVARYLNGNTKNGQPVEIISLDGWVKALHGAALGGSGESDVQGNLSAFKLLPFFTGLLNGDPRPVFETVKSSALSITLKELPAVGARWVAVWLEQWKYQVTHLDSNLFAPLKVGRASLSHRIVMAPMTRRRAAIDFVPTPLMVEYYAQRAGVPGTLLISEATSISPRSAAPPNTPGIWSDAQMDAWKGVTTAVHARGSFIYMQLWVVGRAIRIGALEQGAEAISSGDVPVGPDSPVPRPLREEELQDLIAEFREAAKKAILAGFDGVELHGANGYLLDQFTQDVSNNRTDQWGGSIENRCRFPLAVAKAVASAIGSDKVGYRISPWSRHHGMRMADPVPQFSHLVSRLRELRLSYLHVIESRVQGPMDVPSNIASESVQFAADIWGEMSPIIFAGGYNAHSARQKANEEAEKGRQGLVAFGRTFLSNPDLPTRIQRLLPVTRYIRDLFYEAGKPEGYVDYPSWAEEELRSDGGLLKEHIWPTRPSAVLQ